MNEDPVNRRLAAVLALDVVGFSRLMEEDETATLMHLKDRRTRIMVPLVDRYQGRIFKLAGDAVLVEFASAINAVRCAFELQHAMTAANEGLPEQRHIVVRMGINLGDVMVDGDDLYGDGVNIAARLESSADPGGILVSGTIFDYVHRQAGVEFEDLGSRTFKNISIPVRVFRVAGTPPDVDVPGVDVTVEAPPARPSIAVLPFVNMSGDPEQEYFADGMAEEIITGLSRIRWLTVIARNSSFVYKGSRADARQIGRELNVRYVLEGSVRKAGRNVRITTRLIEAETGGCLWAEHFDGALAGIFDMQDNITASVVGIIEPTVKRAEIERAKRKRPENLGAYDLYLHAIAHMYQVTKASRVTALQFAERALGLDPDYAEVHGVAAWCHFAQMLWEGTALPSSRQGALLHAKAVQRLQTEDATTLAHAAIGLALATRDYEAALEMIRRSIMINPSSVHAHGHGAVINVWAGHYDTGIELAERALRLSPFDPLSVMPLAAMAGAWLMKEDQEAAIAAARRALQIYPTHTPSHLITIVALVKLGRLEDACRAGLAFRAVAPDYRIVPEAPIFQFFVDELRAAGLPD